MAEVDGPAVAQELVRLANDVSEAGASANTDKLAPHIKDGLIRLMQVNEAYAAQCQRANDAAADVVKAKEAHERESLGLQNKKCATLTADAGCASCACRHRTASTCSACLVIALRCVLAYAGPPAAHMYVGVSRG